MSSGCDKRRAGAGRRGFTLVEVLATLVLLAVILPVAMRGIALDTRTAADARDRAEAASLAETKLSELLSSGAWQSGEQSGDFGADWPQYAWKVEVSDWEGSTLKLLSVRVEWTSRGQQRNASVSTLVYTGEN